jgi:hypothetical protein
MLDGVNEDNKLNLGVKFLNFVAIANGLWLKACLTHLPKLGCILIKFLSSVAIRFDIHTKTLADDVTNAKRTTLRPGLFAGIEISERCSQDCHRPSLR